MQREIETFVEVAPRQRVAGELTPYWRGLLVWLLLLAAYLAMIFGLRTETWRLTTAPPWFAWFRRPEIPSGWRRIFFVLPFAVFAGVWLGAMQILRLRCPARVVLPAAVLAVLAMNVTVATMGGNLSAIWAPFDRSAEYFSDVGKVHGIAAFLRGYAANVWQYSVHSRTHPPGAVIFLYLVGHVFGGGVVIASWSAVVVTATGVVPFYLLGRRLTGERAAAIAVALYAVTPSLVLFGATSMDGVFLVPLLWSVYLLQRAIGELKRPALANAIAAGIALTASLMLSYVTVCVAVMMLVYAGMEIREKPRKMARVGVNLAVSGAVVVLLLAAIDGFYGFNYLACFRASRHYDHYLMKTFDISIRRYLDISFSNLIAFLIGVGFGMVVLWGKQTIRFFGTATAAQRFNLAAIVSIGAFSFARLFTRETERIWLFFVPAAVLAAACWIAGTQAGQKKVLQWALGVLFGQTILIQIFLYTVR